MLKKSVLLFSLVVGLSSFAGSISAQSGRKVAPPPASATSEVAAPGAATAADEKTYSESNPRKLPPIYVSPKKREKIKRQINPAKNDKNQDNKSAPPPAAEDEDVITVATDLITVPVAVYDRNGVYIPNLKKDDFKIYEDGKEQEVAYFGAQDKPFTVVLMLDTSPSSEYKIEEIQTAARSFVRELQPQDQVMVIEFDGNVHVLTEATGDRDKISQAIGKADFGYGTSLYDAVDFSLRKRLSKIEGRKAVVLFTDGVDTTSGRGYDETVFEAEEADTLIFPIYYNTYLDVQRQQGGLNAPGTSAGDYALGRKYLEDLADYTGGRVFIPENTPGGLETAFAGIAEELRRQYNIGYYPPEAGKAGQRKQIKVRVERPNLIVRARDSYIVGEE